MALNDIEQAKCKKVLSAYIERKRPPIEKRDQVDLAFRIEKQSVIIYEIRSDFRNSEEKIECEIAKTTFVRSNNHWKIFWMRADLKWHSYPPEPSVQSIEEFVEIVEKDANCCFWG